MRRRGSSGMVFDEQVLAVESLAALRAEARLRDGRVSAPFPAEDTPLRVPAEVERLADGEASVPFRAMRVPVRTGACGSDL